MTTVIISWGPYFWPPMIHLEALLEFMAATMLELTTMGFGEPAVDFKMHCVVTPEPPDTAFEYGGLT